MKPIEEAIQLTARNEIDVEIEERRTLKTQMVGRLYPCVLQGEIDRLLDLKKGLIIAKDPSRGGVIERPEPDTEAPSSRPLDETPEETQANYNARMERKQLHAGKIADKERTANLGLWHTDSDGNYWMGYLYHRTPKQLLQECLTTIRDLLINHPGIEEE
jgi:hypothetical protein